MLPRADRFQRARAGQNKIGLAVNGGSGFLPFRQGGNNVFRAFGQLDRYFLAACDFQRPPGIGSDVQAVQDQGDPEAVRLLGIICPLQTRCQGKENTVYEMFTLRLRFSGTGEA